MIDEGSGTNPRYRRNRRVISKRLPVQEAGLNPFPSSPHPSQIRESGKEENASFTVKKPADITLTTWSRLPPPVRAGEQWCSHVCGLLSSNPSTQSHHENNVSETPVQEHSTKRLASSIPQISQRHKQREKTEELPEIGGNKTSNYDVGF